LLNKKLNVLFNYAMSFPCYLQ